MALKSSPKKARDVQGSGRLPSAQNLIDKTPEEMIRTLGRFGIDPDIEGIYARGKRAYAKVERLIDQGVVPDDATMEALQDSIEKEFSQNLRKMTKTAIRLYKESRNKPDDKMMWMTSGRGSCPSCEKRHGQIKTMTEWKRLGLPGTTSLICGEECNCQLLPAGQVK